MASCAPTNSFWISLLVLLTVIILILTSILIAGEECNKTIKGSFISSVDLDRIKYVREPASAILDLGECRKFVVNIRTVIKEVFGDKNDQTPPYS